MEQAYELTTSDGDLFEVGLEEILQDNDNLDGDARRSIWSLDVGDAYEAYAPVGAPTWSVRRVR